MRHSLYHRAESQDAFTDLLFNALLGFVFMFITAFALIDETSAVGKVDAKAEVLVTVRWPDHHPDDVDTLIEDPQGNLLWYRNRDTGLMHLDRDDRGALTDRIAIAGGERTVPINQETASLRALTPGEYVVNVFHFKSHARAPVPVSVKVEKLNPKVEIVSYETVELTGLGDEKTAVRFTIDAGGQIRDINRLAKPLLSTAVTPK